MEHGAAMPAREEPQIDERIIEACRQGDEEAFRLLFERYKDRVYSIAVYHFHGNESDANDVTQQIFLKLLTTIGQFRGDAEFTTWLYRLVVNACIDEQRRRRRFLPFGDFTAVGRMEDRRPQEKKYARGEDCDSVKTTVKQVEPKFCLPLLLQYS